MLVEARAKINWTLDIVGRRGDGYHLMDMLMQPVTLCDLVTLRRADTLVLTTGGTPCIPAGEDNLALRAARALQAAAGCGLGAAIHVEKRIPAGAGMGGGSADAAAVLVGLNRLWGTGLSTSELEKIGLTLGADVPFCVRGGLCRVGGIGETLSPLPVGRAWPLVCVQPCEGLSTREIFTAYHAREKQTRPQTAQAAEALRLGDGALLARSLGNVLQPVSEERRPDIGLAVERLRAEGAFAAAMTGSGSAVFGIFADAATADRAAEALRGVWTRTYRCDSCDRSVVIREK